MGKKGYSMKNFWGGYDHYDSRGRYIGHSDPGFFGDYYNYDKRGKNIGRSKRGYFGDYTHYDNRGKKIGRSDKSAFDYYHHYDAAGKKIGSSSPGAFGDYSHSDKDGCYIATSVYGSYDTPEVWTLRRFRDTYLGNRLWGRTFIRTYYAISPSLVAVFGNKKWFRNFWLKFLNHLVSHLHSKGYEDSPYEDINWRKS